jgi:hypothetical protein
MAKRLKELNVNSEFHIVDNGSPHGYLNMRLVCSETQEAYDFTVQCFKRVISEFVSNIK